jgi:hypothetical protein
MSEDGAIPRYLLIVSFSKLTRLAEATPEHLHSQILDIGFDLWKLLLLFPKIRVEIGQTFSEQTAKRGEFKIECPSVSMISEYGR